MKTLTFVLCLLLIPLSVLADHEPDHRYEIQGYLLNADRQPLADIGISISSGNQILGRTSSDGDGFYYLKLHLHDSSIGRRLRIATADYSGTITMTATAGDKTTRRLHHANFIAGTLVEGQLEGVGNSRWLYYTGAGLCLLIIVIVVIARYNKYRKHHQRHRNITARSKHRSKRRRRHRT